MNDPEHLRGLTAEERRQLLADMLKEEARQKQSTHPLSYNQQALWFLYQNAPASAAYNIALSVRIRSALDVLALKRAFQAIILRHPSLRTAFSTHSDEVKQVVHGYQELDFDVLDVSGFGEEEIKALVIAHYRQPFDLHHDTLLRVRLFRRAVDDHILLVVINHIVCDGWSIWIILDELKTLYHAEVNRKPANLPQLEQTYIDFVHWQADMVTGPEGQRAESYWREQLSAPLSTLNMPTDRPRPPVQSTSGASYPFSLSPQLSRAVRELARIHKVTLYTLLLSAFQVLLHRYTGQDDILVGSPAAGRDQIEFANVVGDFVNSIVLRADLSNNPAFPSFLDQVHSTVRDARSHQDYPFPLLVQKLNLDRDPSRSPLVQAFFVLQSPHRGSQLASLLGHSKTDETLQWGTLLLEAYPISQQEGQFDLVLEIVETADSLSSVIKFNPDLFDRETIARMAEHYQVLLASVVDNPQQTIAALPILTGQERTQLLETWNDTLVEYSNKCVHELIEDQVVVTPENVAILFGYETVTYRELNQRANKLANYLRSIGVGPEVLVGVCVKRSIELVVAILGVLKAGGAYVPLDPEYPSERTAYILEDSQAQVILTQAQLVGTLPSSEVQIVCIDSDWDRIAQENANNLAHETDSENLAYVIYTSGSTGKPKGVAIQHGNVAALINWALGTFEKHIFNGTLASTSICFDISVFELYVPLCCGGTMIMVENVLAVHEMEQNDNITLINTVPSAMNGLIQLGELPPNVKTVTLCGEPLQVELVNRLCKMDMVEQVFDLYGPTEDTVYSTFALRTLDGPNTIGRPIHNTRTYIFDSQREPVPIGVVGELYLGGAGIARGYLHKPELTAELFVTDPFSGDPSSRLYRTGDLARYLPDGNIEYLGRVDNQVKLRGYRIELGEIEAHLMEIPEVQECVVILLGDRIVAYVVGDTDKRQLGKQLVERLPKYMLPTHYIGLDTLPRLPNGKLDRKSLPEAVEDHERDSWISPRNSLEQQLVHLWEQLLATQQISPHSDFFELGGHSLLAVQLVARVREQFDADLPLTTFFQNPTIEGLAVAIRQNQGPYARKALYEIQTKGTKPPFFCVTAGYGDLLALTNLSRELGSEQPFYALQPPSLDGEQPTYSQIEHLAAHYVRQIQCVQPEGPYYLSGYCSGGLAAFEIAQQLRAQDQTVAQLILLETPYTFARFTHFSYRLLQRAFSGLLPDSEKNRSRLVQILHNMFNDAGLAAHLGAMVGYKPTSYSGRITLFLANISFTRFSFVPYRWQRVSNIGVDTVLTPGDHDNFIREPHVSALAHHLRDALGQTASRVSNY